jgi:cytochrome c biogenesis protein CcmG, thiol:disulfide interchange protein DsbE
MNDAGLSNADRAAAPHKTMRWIALLPLLLFAGLAGLFLIRLFSGDPSTLPSALIGKQAPRLTLAPIPGLMRDGQTMPGIDPQSLSTQGPTLVNIFASWCVPCHQEHPFLMELAKEPGLRLLGLNHKDEPENARRFLNAKGNPFHAVGMDRDGRAAIEWGGYGVPETFLVDAQGRIAHKHVGPLTPDSLDLFRKRVTQLQR